eukprot:TRINITY_DN121_c0_g1_i1.p2 TRINITY_DN121_c0_g1~~TRINITY_DN121_c0_g1_i1.p2  ORF type:complete len:184 (-),score=19.66 TRINITY_DN121_c0_g1_i1:1288-1839(-)
MISKITLFFILVCSGATYSEMDGKLPEIIYEASVSNLQYYMPEMENSFDNEYSLDLEEYEGNGQQQTSKEEVISTLLPTSQVNTVQEDSTSIDLAPIFVPSPTDSIVVVPTITSVFPTLPYVLKPMEVDSIAFVPTVTPLFPTLPYVTKPMEGGPFQGGYEIQGVFEKLLPVQASSDYFFEEY